MGTLNEKEIDLVEGFLDDVTGFLITTYKIASEDVKSGKSSLVMHRVSDIIESSSSIECLEISDLTLLFLNVFFAMKFNEAEIVINSGRVNVSAVINDLDGTVQLKFIDQS